MQNRIIIIDDNQLIRESLRMILQSAGKYVIVSTYSNCEDAIANLERDAPDIVLIDIQLPGISGIEGTTLIRKKLPNCIILIITVSEDSSQVFKSLSAGASGYIIKTASLDTIKKSIEEALAGGAPMSLSISKMVVESFQKQNDSPLSDRESQVLQYISEGKSYSKIADELFISKETVKTHIKNIYRKLEVVSKEDAIRVANKNKWVQNTH
ncbi:response regulator transcription factor [Albibacterium bauzanense]|uniref:LuxR family two component transcriptional regulator n=1 Tax=Albibacterium bauzanense TaxID=653929 RepID=A0A4R1M273_9SPHI|nr:response regulator transcription factor [Albibacterium bauzanense]TCK84934.1 LuxR family two component transcriptional regulator [Albibacterium bauzanense]